MHRPFWIQVISGILIFLFLYTAFSKWMDFKSFRQVLSMSPLIGQQARWLAFFIPFSESVIALFLFFPVTRLIGLYASAILLLFFTGYIVYMLLYAPSLPCSCGGIIRQLSWKQHLWFNLFFSGLSIRGTVLQKRQVARFHPQIPLPSREDVS